VGLPCPGLLAAQPAAMQMVFPRSAGLVVEATD